MGMRELFLTLSSLISGGNTPVHNKAACSCPSSVQVCWGNLTNFITCFPLAKPLVQVLGQGTWTTAGCLVIVYVGPGGWNRGAPLFNNKTTRRRKY